MASVKVSVKPEIIDWVMSRTSEEYIGFDYMDLLREWKKESKQPTFSQIENISKRSRIPLGYFFLDNPPKEEIKLIEYRTVDSVELLNPSRELIDTVYEMEEIQQWMKEYRIDSGYNELNYVGSVKRYSDIISISNRIRNDLGMPKEWYETVSKREDAFRYVRNLLMDCGVIVMLNGIVGNNTHRTLNIDEFRAFALVDEWAPLIFINSVDSESAKLFSLFHELSHIWIGENDLYNDRRHSNNKNHIEIICNAVASELMLPQDLFIKKWNSFTGTDDSIRIKEIAHHTKCSECVIARKALDNKLISTAHYNDVVEESIWQFQEYRKNKKNGGNYYRTAAHKLDGNLVLALCDSIAEGKTTYTEAYRLTNTSRKTFSEVASSFGGVV